MGTVIARAEDGTLTKRYYHLNFVYRNGEVVDMYKDTEAKIYQVSEELKELHWKKYYEAWCKRNKVLV
ncbi:hypothetical protein FPZ49_10820 [Paenibacillus cremeus]|uniref:Uncharacterized protein n=1 Tax=Paenibacillus cremeus TaxID=2163881 RepID=A0A559KCK0_9BACL|nr:hypothetical protein FPZ49_10820 [Paenibacillus cremeus]